MRNLYILSGLGADERIFKNCSFNTFTPKFIPWKTPLKNETIESYATRLIQEIQEKEPILLGISFGGIIAIEIAKQIEVEKLYLISSIETKLDIPISYRIAGALKLYKILPYPLLKSTNSISNWLFGVSEIQDKILLRQIIQDTDVHFLKWAIQQILTWDNEKKIERVTTIHGTKDKLLPLAKKNYDVLIQNGGHLMILTEAKTICKHIV
jgi:pimeloyl-ACP methyl ester carboxylesterase